ncbi:MAG: dihydrolipoyl dehydrogenase [Clostridium sp.]|nr:dihydrolipoyl dehydrogenase [Clostridium sp.]
MPEQYDLIIIGGGPGGYTAASRAAFFGMKTALIEKEELGGACVNTGCIPAKAILQATSVYRDVLQASRFGIKASNVGFDLKKMQEYKRKSVEEFRGTILRSLEDSGAELIYGEGRLHRDNLVEVFTKDGVRTLKGTNVILATGSRALLPDIPGVDLPQVMTSRTMLQAEEWHFDCLTVIGGGVIGVELAAIFAALGSKVTILERSSCLLSDMDPAASEQLEDSLRGRGIDVRCNVDVMQITERSNDTVSVCFQEQGSWKEVPADRVLVAAGRTSYLGNVLAEDCEVTVKNGSPVVKGAYRTTQKNVFAIGDVASHTKLAHVAASQAIYVVEELAGCRHRMQLTVVPNGMYVVLPVVPVCIYTDPEIAAVGFTVEDARVYNMKVKCGMAHLNGNGKAILCRETNGFVRLIFEAYTNTLVGAQIMCPRATDMIGEMATAIANGLTAYQLSTAMRAHPTYSEAIAQAIEDALNNG